MPAKGVFRCIEHAKENTTNTQSNISAGIRKGKREETDSLLTENLIINLKMIVMKDDDFKIECFGKAETGLLSVIHWLEGCRKNNTIENLTTNNIDKMKIVETAFEIKANINNLEVMYASLFILSQTYNKSFASYMSSDRLAMVLENFESMKDTATYLKECLSSHLSDAIDLELIAKDSTSDNICTHEAETSTNIFDKNIFTTIEKLESYNNSQVISDFLDLTSTLYKSLLATLMLCRTIIQEEQKVLENVELLEKIYQQNLNDVWESLKDLFEAFHQEDFKDEITVARKFMDNTAEQLHDNFHQWTLKQFQRHVIATKFCSEFMKKPAEEQIILLFPNNPEKEKVARQVVMALDCLELETRGGKSSPRKQFTSLSILTLKDKIGYDGEMATFIKYLHLNYHGEFDFPKPSALSIKRHNENVLSMKTDARSIEKWTKDNSIINRIGYNIDKLIATINAKGNNVSIPIGIQPPSQLARISV